jgi:hypothetical protein
MAYILTLSATAIMMVATSVKILKCMSYIYIFYILALCTLRDVLCNSHGSLWHVHEFTLVEEEVRMTPGT